jgi:multiple sugar transport system substrate-binding protein
MAFRVPARRVAVVAGFAVAALGVNVVGVTAQGPVTLGSYQSDEKPKAALQAGIDYCTAQTGVQVQITTTNHNDFQEAITSYLQGTPDDIFTWFTGYRLRYFADQGFLAPIDDVYDQVTGNFSDAIKTSVTGNDGSIYMVPWGNYPWVVMYRKSVFADKGYTVPTNWDEFVTLADKMKADGLIPLAFTDKDGWPAMGTFDILNMRLNGYQFHVDLMAGKEKWSDPRVTAVFDAWKKLLPYYSDGALGLTWQEGAQQLMTDPQKAGMYFLGTFATQQATDPAIAADIDFFPFPTLGTEFDSELGIDAPIDGFAMSAKGSQSEDAKKILACIGTAGFENAVLAVDPSNVGVALDVDTSGYNDVQKKSADLIAGSKAIAQFLDRDTIPAFASTVMIPKLQEWLGNPDQDMAAFQQSIQEQWDTIAAEQG